MSNFGPEVKAIQDGATDVFDIPCGSTGVYYSRAIPIRLGKFFAAMWKATSSGTTTLKIEYEVGKKLPTTEGSADAVNWCTPDSASDVDTSLADENLHSDAVNPPAFPYMRFKITASGGNDASTVLNLWLSVQEEA